MLNSNFRHLVNTGRINSRLLSNPSSLSMLRSSRLLSRRGMMDKNALLRFVPKRNFNKRIDRALEDLISRLPNGNIGIAFVGINTFFYFLYLIWPRDIIHKFYNNFTISQYNLSRGRVHTLLLSHFAHLGFLSYALDSLIVYLFCQNLTYMFGPVYIAKLAMMSIV
mmetsp:Transcript_26245/g.26153  ORF Transcript_26245/g.26153 Transcript_26245/m.26153 type:complete len:166 (+) Transcript_26245:2-499(+)